MIFPADYRGLGGFVRNRRITAFFVPRDITGNALKSACKSVGCGHPEQEN
jgi:hypothetical protein